jgi:threonine dehydratase
MSIDLEAVKAARDVVYRTLRATPLLSHPLLDVKTGLTVFVKHPPARSRCAAA